MYIQVEPVDFFMYSVKLYFDLDDPNPEDQPVRDYLTANELEPKYQGAGAIEGFDGHQCQVMRFGGCYLGKHLERIGQIQRRAVEAELLTAAIEQHLNDSTPEGAMVSPEGQQETIARLLQEFHHDSSFKTGENGELIAALDGETVRQAARRIGSGGAKG